MLKELVCSLLEKPKDVTFDGEDDDEPILYIFRRAFITNLDWVFISLVLIFVPFLAESIIVSANKNLTDFFDPGTIFVGVAFWYMFTFGYIFQNFLNWFFNVYIITTKRIIDIDFIGFLYKNISEAPLTNIEDITSNVSGTLRVIFNYGSVFIQTAAEKTEFEFSDVSNPSKIRDILSDIVTKIESEGRGKQ